MTISRPSFVRVNAVLYIPALLTMMSIDRSVASSKSICAASRTDVEEDSS